jgi:hypothetical protein
VLSGDDDDL